MACPATEKLPIGALHRVNVVEADDMITVFGSINLDLTFRLPHLPAAGETVLTDRVSEAVGGKGANQAIAAARDGATTRFVGCVGADGMARRRVQRCRASASMSAAWKPLPGPRLSPPFGSMLADATRLPSHPAPTAL